VGCSLRLSRYPTVHKAVRASDVIIGDEGGKWKAIPRPTGQIIRSKTGALLYRRTRSFPGRRASRFYLIRATQRATPELTLVQANYATEYTHLRPQTHRSEVLKLYEGGQCDLPRCGSRTVLITIKETYMPCPH